MHWTNIPRNQLIVAVDFDGTCVTHQFPNTGEEIGAAPILQKLASEGVRLILWTMRDKDTSTRAGNHLKNAINWFETHGIPLWGINRNPEQHWSTSPKAFAHLYIDDMALGCPLIHPEGARPHVDWPTIETIFWPS